MLHNDVIDHHGKRAMALGEFEIAIGGLTSIPVVGGLIFLGYKSFGEIKLNTSKLKPKKKPAITKETSKPDKKPLKQITKGQNINTTTNNKENNSVDEQRKSDKGETSKVSTNQPEDKSKVMPANQTTKLAK